MLVQRVLTAIPLVALVVWLVLYSPVQYLTYFLVLVAFLAASEWIMLAGYHNNAIRIAFAGLMAVFAYLVILRADLIPWLLYVSLLSWLVVVIYLFKVRPVQSSKSSVLKAATGFIIILPTVVSIAALKNQPEGGVWLLFALSLVWVADTGAYFSGKQFGKNKLAKHISPGKTIEGLIGALVLNAIYVLFIAQYVFELEGERLLLLILLALVVTLFSVAGDLFESVLKRQRGVKDSGAILPGHGGVLDRIDGVLPAMPIFLVGYQWVMNGVIA